MLAQIYTPTFRPNLVESKFKNKKRKNYLSANKVSSINSYHTLNTNTIEDNNNKEDNDGIYIQKIYVLI